MKVFCPWVIRPRPMTLRGICTGIRRAASAWPSPPPPRPPGSAPKSEHLAERERPLAARSPTICTRPGHSRSRIEKVMSRLIPLPMPRSVICSPSHITNTAPVVSTTTIESRVQKVATGTAPGMLSVKTAKAYAWVSAMATVSVAGPLGELLLALLVLLHLADRGHDAARQLEDDRGRDVGHDAQREDRGAGQAAAQRVVQPEEARGGRVPDEVRDRLDVDSGRKDVRADR